MSDVYWARSGHEHPVPKGFVGYTDKVSFPYVGDVGRAKQLLAEAGYRDEVSVPVTVNDKAQLRRELEVVSGQFARVAVRVAIQMTHVRPKRGRQKASAHSGGTGRRPEITLSFR